MSSVEGRKFQKILDANVRFVGTKGGAEMLGKDVGTYPALVSGMNGDEVGEVAVVAGT